MELEGDLDEGPNLAVFIDMFLKHSVLGASAFFHGIIFVYDSNNPCTLEPMSDWMLWFHRTVSQSIKRLKREHPVLSDKLDAVKKQLGELPVVLIANKCDKFLKKKQTKIADLVQSDRLVDKFGENVKGQFDLIGQAFDFRNNKNVLFLSIDSADKEFEMLISFIEQTYAHSKSSLQSLPGRRRD